MPQTLPPATHKDHGLPPIDGPGGKLLKAWISSADAAVLVTKGSLRHLRQVAFDFNLLTIRSMLFYNHMALKATGGHLDNIIGHIS